MPKDTWHFVALIRRIFSENNINILLCGFKIVRNLCRGLGKYFSPQVKSIMSYVYLKLKDTKAQIVDETILTLKMMMTSSIALDEMHEDIRTGLKDKSPLMRLNTLKLLKEFTEGK